MQKSCLGIQCDLLVRLIVPATAKAPLWRDSASADCSDCLIFGFTLFLHFVHFEKGQRSKLSGLACFAPVPTRGLINKTIYADYIKERMGGAYLEAPRSWCMAAIVLVNPFGFLTCKTLCALYNLR